MAGASSTTTATGQPGQAQAERTHDLRDVDGEHSQPLPWPAARQVPRGQNDPTERAARRASPARRRVPGAAPTGGIVRSRGYRRSQSHHYGLRGHPVPSLLTHDPVRGKRVPTWIMATRLGACTPLPGKLAGRLGVRVGMCGIVRARTGAVGSSTAVAHRVWYRRPRRLYTRVGAASGSSALESGMLLESELRDRLQCRGLASQAQLGSAR